MISDSGLWLGRLAGRWVVGRRNGDPSDVSGNPISLLVLLERDWSVAQLEIADLELSSPGMEPISFSKPSGLRCRQTSARTGHRRRSIGCSKVFRLKDSDLTSNGWLMIDAFRSGHDTERRGYFEPSESFAIRGFLPTPAPSALALDHSVDLPARAFLSGERVRNVPLSSGSKLVVDMLIWAAEAEFDNAKRGRPHAQSSRMCEARPTTTRRFHDPKSAHSHQSHGPIKATCASHR